MLTLSALTFLLPLLATIKAAPTKRDSAGPVGIDLDSDSGSDIGSFTSAPGSRLSWYANWDYNANPNAGSLQYVPMVWGSGSVSGVQAAAANWPSGVDHVLSFNEPDQSSSVGGSDIDPSTAATLHQQWVSDLGGSYLIGSPAVARGGNAWLQSWVDACNGNCKYDFVPFHFYGTDAQDLISYAQSFYSQFGKPLWLTEWACTNYGSTTTYCADQAAVESFMQTVIAWFEGDGSGIVERWSWFGAFESSSGNVNGLENSDGSANSLGQYYVAL